jgi:hypothetical protein
MALCIVAPAAKNLQIQQRRIPARCIGRDVVYLKTLYFLFMS